MSCEKNGLRAGTAARVGAGVSAMASRAGNAVGVMAGRVVQGMRVASQTVAQAADATSNNVGRAVAPLSNQIVQAVDRPATLLATAAPVLATAVATTAAFTQMRVYTAGPEQGARPGVAVAIGMRDAGEIARNLQTLRRVGKAIKTVRTAQLGASIIATGVASSTQTPEGQRSLTQTRRSMLLGERQTKVEFSGSKLTGWLNRQDRLLSSRQVVSSDGDVVHAQGGAAWHRGTTVVRTPGGERTITHLRSLSLPSNGYYFDRRLSDEEVATIVTGQGKSHQMAGYVGAVSAMENLAPGWAHTKRAMILTRLHWPTPGTDWITTPPQADEARPTRQPEAVVIQPPPTAPVRQVAQPEALS